MNRKLKNKLRTKETRLHPARQTHLSAHVRVEETALRNQAYRGERRTQASLRARRARRGGPHGPDQKSDVDKNVQWSSKKVGDPPRCSLILACRPRSGARGRSRRGLLRAWGSDVQREAVAQASRIFKNVDRAGMECKPRARAWKCGGAPIEGTTAMQTSPSPNCVPNSTARSETWYGCLPR
jgi:hypothetical protein